MVKTFEADFRDTKKCEFECQKSIASKLSEEIIKVLNSPNSELQKEILRNSNFQRKCMMGEQLKQNSFFNHFSLSEAYHLADLSGDEYLRKNIILPLMNWLIEMEPHIKNDKPSNVIKKPEVKDELKGQENIIDCEGCGLRGIKESFCSSNFGDKYLKCSKCNMNFMV